MSQERHSRRGRRTANHDMADARREGAGFSQLTQAAAEAAAAATTGPLPIVTAPSEPILSGTSRQAHFHRKPRTGWLASLMEHRGRFASFSVIGGGVFLLGLAMQVVLVRDAHLNAIAAFFLQGFVSVQVSFLLNHFWTGGPSGFRSGKRAGNSMSPKCSPRSQTSPCMRAWCEPG